MNKIKTLYDVVQELKAQEKFDGTGTVKVTRDGDPVFEAEKTFEKNIAEGTMKGKIKTEVHHDGCNLKNESEFDFDMNACGGRGFHHGMGRGRGHGPGMRRHMMKRMHGQGQCLDENGSEDAAEMKRGFMMKHKLNKISMMLDALNRLEIKESDEGGKTLHLEMTLDQMPEDLKRHIKMHTAHCKGHGPHGDHFKDIESVDDLKIVVNGRIDEENKVKSIQVDVAGLYSDKEGDSHNLDVSAQMALK